MNHVGGRNGDDEDITQKPAEGGTLRNIYFLESAHTGTHGNILPYIITQIKYLSGSYPQPTILMMS